MTGAAEGWQAGAAALPILVIIFLMVGRGWSAARAALAGLAVTGLTSFFVFGFGSVSPGRSLRFLTDFGGAGLEAGFIAATILWIIFPALCIFELLSRAGSFEALRTGLGRLSGDPRVLAVLVAWFFALFLEGAAGFGTPVALAAPLLVSLGFGPVRAVTVVLIGHAAGVSFGAIGTPVFVQAAATGLPEISIAASTALIHAVPGILLVAATYWLAVPKTAAANEAVVPPTFWVVPVAAVLFFVPYLAIASLLGPELPTLLAALLGGVLFVIAIRWFHRGGAQGALAAEVKGDIWRAVLPYAVLIVLIAVTRLVPPVQDAARAIAVSWTFAETYSGTFQPLYHPGTMLFAGFVIGGLLMGRSPRDLVDAAAGAARRLVIVTVALVAMLFVARIMVHAGMIAALADAAAAGTGPAWPVLAPAVGALGTFVTGSATASNILFTDFQVATAQSLGLPLLTLVAAQGFGAAIGNMLCPHNVIAGAATVGLAGREGDILKRTVPIGLAYALAGGLMVLILVVL